MNLQSLPCGPASKETLPLCPSVTSISGGPPCWHWGPAPGRGVPVQGFPCVDGGRDRGLQVNKFEHVHRCGVATWGLLGQTDWEKD